MTFDPVIVELLLPLLHGGSVALMENGYWETIRAPNRLFETIRMLEIDTLLMTPHLFMQFSASQRDSIFHDATATSIRRVVLGGDVFPPCLLKESRGSHVQLWNIYGTTECSIWATLGHMNANANECVHLGMPIPGTRVELRSSDGTTIHTADVQGEIWLGGEDRLCFVNEEMDQPPRMRPTGDCAKWTERKQLVLVGRISNFIKRQGHRLHLNAIRSELESHLGLVCMASVVNDELIAICWMKPGAKISDRWQTLTLPPYATPDSVYLLPHTISLPLTTNGKLDQRAILSSLDGWREYRHDYLDLIRSSEMDDHADLSQWIASLYETSLRYTNVGPISDVFFLASGGTSLDATRITEKIVKRYFGKDHGIREFVRTRVLTAILHDSLENVVSTIRALIDSGVEQKGTNIEKEEDANITALPKRQRRMIQYSAIIHNRHIHVPLVACSTNPNPIHIEHVWKVNLQKCIDASPLVLVAESDAGEEPIVIVASHSGLAAAMRANSGEIQWTYQLSDRTETSAVYMPLQRVVVFVCYDGSVHFLDVDTGRLAAKWQCDSSETIKAIPAIHGNRIYLATYADNLYELDYCGMEEVKVLRKWNLKGSVFAGIVVDECQELVVVATLSGYVYVASLNSNESNWTWYRQVSTVPIFAKPVLRRAGILCVVSVDGTFHRLDLATGKVVGSVLHANNKTENIFSTPCPFDDSLLLCTNRGTVCRWQLRNGNLVPLWEVSVEGANFFASPSVITSTIDARSSLGILVQTSGVVVVLDMKDGAILASYQLSGEVFSSPVILSQASEATKEVAVYVGCRNDHLYKLCISF